jgi:5-methylcytosine-specific restriction endonuclease McrA
MPSETFHPKWSKESREKASRSHTKIIIDPDDLRDLYVNHHLSIADLAKFFDCGDSTIRTNLKKNNIPIRSLSDAIRGRKCSAETKEKLRKANRTHVSKEFLIEEYVNKNKTLSQIGKEMGMNHHALSRWMTDYNIPQRPSNESVSIGQRGKIRVPLDQRKHVSKGYKIRGEWLIGRHHTEETRKKMSLAAKGPLNHNWRNGARQEPYCFKFNFSLKESIRDEFDRKCVLCGGVSEGGRRLDIHHIDYNKMQGCGHNRWNLVPLCNKCHGKMVNDRWYWFNLLHCYWANRSDIKFSDFNRSPHA